MVANRNVKKDCDKPHDTQHSVEPPLIVLGMCVCGGRHLHSEYRVGHNEVIYFKKS